MTATQVALALSIVGVVLSLFSIGWNINVFIRSGPKVKTTLIMGSYGPGPGGIGKATTTVDPKGWGKFKTLRETRNPHFFVHATNVGRAAIWVDEVGLTCGGTITNMNVIADQGEGDLGFGPGLPYKLDAGQTVRWALPMSNASSLWNIGPVPDTACVHGHVRLGNGTVLRTNEGARVGLVREVLAREAEGT